MRRFNLPSEALLVLIEARTFDLYDDPMPRLDDLEGYCADTSASLFRLAAQILADGDAQAPADLCTHAGIAHGLTGLLRAFPRHARRQQCFLPHERLIDAGVTLDDIFSGLESPGLHRVLSEIGTAARAHLDRFRSDEAGSDPRVAPAFYPLALVEPYLDAMAKPDYRPFFTPIEISPLRKIARMMRASLHARRH